MAEEGGYYCVVPRCKNKSIKNKGLSWHSFPTDESLCQLWVNNIISHSGETVLNRRKYSKVCSAHFTRIDFKPLLHSKNKILKQGVYPTVFPSLLDKGAPSTGKILTPIADVTENDEAGKDIGYEELKENPEASGEITQTTTISKDSTGESEAISVTKLVTKLANKLATPNECSSAKIDKNISLELSVSEEGCNCGNANKVKELEETVSQLKLKLAEKDKELEETVSQLKLKLAEKDKELEETVSQLKLKLAEKDKELEETVSQLKLKLAEKDKELEETVSQLKLKLAEKDKEIDELRHGKLEIDLKNLKSKSEKLESELKESKTKVDSLNENKEKWKFYAEKLRKQLLNISFIKGNPEVCAFYTGFINYGTLESFLTYLKKKAKVMQYWNGKKTKQDYDSSSCKRGNKRHLDLEDEFFLVMVRLRLGMPLKELARISSMSESTVSTILTTWISLLHFELLDLFPFPTREAIYATMPAYFHEYPNTRIIIDCTEFRVERPSSISAQRCTFSNYKNYNTLKCLIGISPGNAVTFVSKLYGGACSDKFIVDDSKLMSLLSEPDDIMADKGFEIESLLPKGVTLNIPPLFRASRNPQMPTGDVLKTKSIAKVRVHVERAIRRIKAYHIFDSPIPLSMSDIAENIVAVCAYLTNFSPPLVREMNNSSVTDD